MGYTLHDPFLLHVCVGEIKGKHMRKVGKKVQKWLSSEDEFIVFKDMFILKARSELGSRLQGGGNGKRTFSPDELKSKFKLLGERCRKFVVKSGFFPDLPEKELAGHFSTFDVLVAGSYGNYWSDKDVVLETFRVGIDESPAYQPAVDSGLSRLAALSNNLYDSSTVLSSSASMFGFDSLLYSFLPTAGNEIRLGKHQNQPLSFFIVEYPVEESDIYIDRSTDSRNKMMGSYLSILVRFIALHFHGLRLYQNEYRPLQQESRLIRKEVMQVHKIIDKLLFQSRMSQQARNLERGKARNEKQVDEVSLLHKASVNFTKLMEVDEKLAKIILLQNHYSNSIEGLERELGLTNQSRETGNQMIEHESLKFHFSNLRKGSSFAFNNLKEHIGNSQSRLRHGIDSFKRYQDTSRRVSSERSEKLFNLVFMLLAVLALGDAVGNFLVYAEETGHIYRAVLGFIVVFIVLAIIFGAVYQFVFSRLFSD